MIVSGSLESNDCLITLSPAETFGVRLESVVYAAYGKHIEQLITKECEKLKLTNIAVHCQDQGALDVTIMARLKEACAKYREDHLHA